jgi:hypothetical protein
MVLFLALLLQQVDPSREAADWIRLLGSESPEDRDQAALRLKTLGTAAKPALEAASRSGDADVRARARGLLEDIARAERVKALHPSGRRVTLELRDVSVGEAVVKTLHPFGMTGVKVESQGKGRLIALSLRDVALWEAVDGLEKAAGIRVDLSSGELSDRPEPEVLPSGTGDVRIGTSGSWGSHSGPGGSESVLHVTAWLPPGAWACSAELEEVELTAEGGGKIPSRLMPELEGERRRGLPTRMEVGGIAVRPENLKGFKKASVRGTLRLGFPRDLERIERPILPLPSEVALLGGTVKLASLARTPDEGWKLELESSGGSEPFSVLLSVEDAAGAWLGDLATLRPKPGTSSSRVGWWEPSVEGKPARWVILRSVGEVSVKVPFALSPIDVPRSQKD